MINSSGRVRGIPREVRMVGILPFPSNGYRLLGAKELQWREWK